MFFCWKLLWPNLLHADYITSLLCFYFLISSKVKKYKQNEIIPKFQICSQIQKRPSEPPARKNVYPENIILSITRSSPVP